MKSDNNSAVGIILNPSKVRVVGEVKSAIGWLKKQGFSVYLEKGSSFWSEEAIPRVTVSRMGEISDVIIVFGGDGTILKVAGELAETGTPILGINSGHLGFLTETTLSGLETALQRVLDNSFRISERSMLEGIVDGRNKKLLALNDLVLSREKHGRVVEISAKVNGQPVTKFVSDGILISTPTGSTAYNMAANGPIVHPQLEALILNPICPHTLTNRPLILPSESEIVLEILTDDCCNLIADGQKKIRELSRGDVARIRQASCKTSLIVPPDLSFYELLGSKLQWSGRA